MTTFRRAAPGKQNGKYCKADFYQRRSQHPGRMVSDGSLYKCCMHAAHRFSKSDLSRQSFKSTARHHQKAVGRLSSLRDPRAFQHWPDRAAKGDAFRGIDAAACVRDGGVARGWAAWLGGRRGVRPDEPRNLAAPWNQFAGAGLRVRTRLPVPLPPLSGDIVCEMPEGKGPPRKRAALFLCAGLGGYCRAGVGSLVPGSGAGGASPACAGRT